MFARVGRWCFEKRWATIGIWLVALFVVFGIAGAKGAGYSDEMSIPSSESADGFDIVEANFGKEMGSFQSGNIVFKANQGVDDPAVKSAMTDFFAKIPELRPDGADGKPKEGGDKPITGVVSPYTEQGARQISSTGALAGKVAYASVSVDNNIEQTDAANLGKKLRELQPEIDGVEIQVGGQIFGEFEPPESEVVGLAFAIVVLILAFGSVLAMGLPIGVALAGVSMGSGLVILVSHLTTVPEFSPVIGTMIGLGVGIDYALFIVTRYREGLHEGRTPLDATMIAMDTAGRAVIFAGMTVVISLLGMLLIGLSFVSGLGIAAATTVAVTMLASITLLPAFLGFARERVEVTKWRGIIMAGLIAVAMLGAGLKISVLTVGLPLAVVVLIASFALKPLRKEVPKRAPKPLRETASYRWSRVIQHRPWIAAIGGTLLMLLLAVPVLSLRLGFSDDGNSPAESSTKKAYDLLAEGFGPGFNGPFMVVMEVKGPEQFPAVLKVVESIKSTEGVAQALGPIPSDLQNPTASKAAMIQVVPTTAPQDQRTDDLVKKLRSDVIPAAVAGTDLQPKVTGFVPIAIDFSSYLAGRMIIFFAVVLALSFLLLMTVFRSILVPLKAVIMNMLSLAAAYGIVVAIFQWGWGGSALGISGGPIEPFIPMMMFAIVFGLSMDYEVFLLSRVKEEYERSGDAKSSVADGLAATARVITAAAAIMVVVFGSFLFEDMRVIKLFGMGLAVAVLLDATVIRMLLVPATMELLGERNWWIPKWLDRILPNLNVEGSHDKTIRPADGSADHGGSGSSDATDNTDGPADPDPLATGVPLHAGT